MEKTLTMPELRRKGLSVLLKELGAVGFVEFLRDMGLQQDDYTEWRKNQPEPKNIEEAIRNITAKK